MTETARRTRSGHSERRRLRRSRSASSSWSLARSCSPGSWPGSASRTSAGPSSSSPPASPILLIGLLVANEQGMVIGGTVVTTVGLVLLYQDQTGRWESWAYAWALVGPAASGLGLVLWGLRSGNAQRHSQRDLGPARRARHLRHRVPLLRGRDRDRWRSAGASRVAAAGGGDRDRGGRAAAGTPRSVASPRGPSAAVG